MLPRRFRIAAAIALLMTLALTACSETASDSGSTTPTAPDEAPSEPGGLPARLEPEPGTDIPEVMVRVGFTPFGDGLIGVAGQNLGYFDEVGISFTEQNGIRADFSESFAPLLNGQVEMASAYIPFFAQQNVTNLRAFLPTNTYLGTRILAPEGEYETVADLMAEGDTFEEAARKAMEQLRGKRLLMQEGVTPIFYDLALSTAGMSLADMDVVRLSNADIVRAASSGQTDFAAPDGAIQITQLQHSGWEPIVDVGQVIEAMPEDTVDLRSAYTAYVTTTEYAASDYNTLLRFTSVIYRLVAELEADPIAVAAQFRDYLNSYTGSSLSVEEVAGMFSGGLYDFRTFEEAADYFGPSTTSPYLFDETVTALLATLSENGVVSEDKTVDDLSIAAQVHHDLLSYKDAAEALLASAPDGDLKASAEELLDSYNFLDAYRLALAASDEGAE